MHHTGFREAQCMGKYLGENINHGRSSRNKFCHIIKQFQWWLSVKKPSVMSLSGWITLWKSVLSSIIYFHMQFAKILNTICKDLEYLCYGPVKVLNSRGSIYFKSNTLDLRYKISSHAKARYIFWYPLFTILILNLEPT